MAKVLNVGVKKFRENVKEKEIVLWGAGKLASFYIQTICEKLDIICLIDQNKSLCESKLVVDNLEYPIISEAEFLIKLEKGYLSKKDVAIFVTPTAFTGEIIRHINDIAAFDTIECYSGLLLRDFYEAVPFTFTKGVPKIPKKIHYCWFGGKTIPEKLQRCMDSWKRFCPDYEIIRWDESNYDITKNRYMKEAYDCKKWGFVPDYARLDIIYNEGGIYLDTDVELLSSLDRVLNDEMFCGFQCNFQINFGCGFGAIVHHPLIKELRDYYNDKSFYLKDGKMNMKACYEYQHPVLKKWRFNLENQFQKRTGVVVYPSEVLAPSMGIISNNFTPNTVSIHHMDFSWAGAHDRKAFDLLKKEIADLVR